MTNKFWFYFFGIPVLFGLLCFSVPISFKITNEIPVFEDALEQGASMFFHKPFDLEELIEALKKDLA